METTGVCRVCLTKKANKNISDLKTHSNDTSTEIILFCLDIQIESTPHVSTKLCLKCYRKIISFYDFKTLALKNDRILRNEVTLKEEDFFSDSLTLNDLEENNAESQNEDKVYVQNNLNLEESKDVLSSDKSILKFNEIKLEIIKSDDSSNDTQSDDELLSVIKKIKYEYTPNNVDDTKENEVVKKKRGRKKIIKNTEEKAIQVCNECGKTVRNLKEHLNLHLPPGKRKRVPCKLCDKTFSSHNARYKHNKIKHLGFRYCCPICKKRVVNVRQHTLVMHESSELPIACTLCERRFISKSALAAHISIHTTDRPHDCDICNKKFRTKILMLQHKRSVHDMEKSHMCQYCSKSFFKKYHLQMHIRTHTKEKPHECPSCGKCFSTSTILRNHQLIHSDVKAYACSFCDMTFVRAGYLRAHMISHTKEKRYPCRYCGFKFGRSDHRKRHEATAHEKHLLAMTSISNSAVLIK